MSDELIIVLDVQKLFRLYCKENNILYSEELYKRFVEHRRKKLVEYWNKKISGFFKEVMPSNSPTSGKMK